MWVAAFVQGEDSITIARPNGEVERVLDPRDDIIDALAVIQTLTSDRVDVLFVDRDGYESVEST